MPQRPRVPSYRHHKPTDQAVVTLNGKDVYLGPWNTVQSRQEYDRLIGEWLANDRRLPSALGNDLTVTELIAAYWRFAGAYYSVNGKPTGTLDYVRIALAPLRKHYGHTCAREFGPLALKALRERLIRAGHARVYVNKQIDVIRRAFRWAVGDELLLPSVDPALRAVPGLRKGRSEARETAPVRPVCDEVVETTVPHLPPIVANMVRFQRLTGCRPNELLLMRPCDVTCDSTVWAYRPESHKTEHLGRERVILIGPRAQDVLRPYLLRDKQAFCFVPGESERKRSVRRREQRQTPMTPSQAKRRPTKNRQRAPGARYTTGSYRRAIHRACDKAKTDRWSPNQLRHTAATEIRRRYGLEAAQVRLGIPGPT